MKGLEGLEAGRCQGWVSRSRQVQVTLELYNKLELPGVYNPNGTGIGRATRRMHSSPEPRFGCQRLLMIKRGSDRRSFGMPPLCVGKDL